MNRQKILYVNYMLQYGHVNFDRIQISALKSTGHEVKLIFHYDIAKQLDFPASDYALIIPKCLGTNSDNPIINRLLYIMTLLFIKIKIRFSRYDKVIVSNLDELTLGLVPLTKKMYIFCHSNSNDFESSIKKTFLKKLAKNNRFIVFNEFMKEPFTLNGIHHLLVISHGCISPFIARRNQVPLDLSKYKFVVFHPSTKIENSFLNELKTNESLHHFLTDNHVALIVRDKNLVVNQCNHIIVLKDYLTVEQYQALFLASNIILLVYPETFKYKVSGISYECFANHKRLLIYDNASLKYCNEYYNYDPMFSSTAQLCEKIKYLQENESAAYLATDNILKPNYSSILDDL